MWTYCFKIVAQEPWRVTRSLRRLLGLLPEPIDQVVMTEREFEDFREGLKIHGLVLLEVKRSPYSEPEEVR